MADDAELAGKLEKVRDVLRSSKKPVALTGAGISAESGVPTFRGADGLWRNFRAEELATPYAFRENPRLVWEWYEWRRGIIGEKKPNPAHETLVELERRLPGFTLVTQNVDGLHEFAGSRRVLELHGNIWKVRCTECQGVREDRRHPLLETGESLPECPECGGLLRPHVVWFGEMLSPEVLYGALQAIEQCDILLVVGTSAIVEPAASMIFMARDHGAFVAEFNLSSTRASPVANVTLLGKAGALLPRILW